MGLPQTPAERHQAISGEFTDRVRHAGDWDSPTPVAGWVARDVVRHLVEWFPALLADGSTHRIPPGPGVDDDPMAAWQHQADAVQALLDDPEAAADVFTHPHIPPLPLAEVIDRFYTADVFMHTWDLAVATGQDARLDPDFCQELYDGMVPMEQVLRESGQYGAAVAVLADANAQTLLLGFIGRDPDWTAPARNS